MTDTQGMTPTAATMPRIPCRRCKGEGVFEWAPGKSGPCFLCNGTGDGRIRNFQGFGPRRARRYSGNGAASGNGATAPAPVITETMRDDTGEPIMVREVPAPAPVIAGEPMTAAQHMAAALAALAPALDESAVKRILASELGDTIAKLERLIDQAIASRTALTEAIAGIPRRLIVSVGDDHLGELPAMRHHLVESLLIIVAQSPMIPAYIVGPAGSGKTTACHQIATALGRRFYLQGAMCGSHEILGYMDAYGVYHSTPWRQAYEHGGIMCLDEIDASDAGALLAANAGIANGHMSFPDSVEPIARHPDFRLIACANTFGHGADRQYVGRVPLDAATLNRFAFLAWDYDESLENQLCSNADWTRFVQAVRASVFKNKIRHVMSPRQTVYGAQLLAAGMPRATVESIVIWQGMSEADIARVRESV